MISAPALLVAARSIRVGVLHSLSGAMAISGTTLKDTMLMLTDERNAKAGVLGMRQTALAFERKAA